MIHHYLKLSNMFFLAQRYPTVLIQHHPTLLDSTCGTRLAISLGTISYHPILDVGLVWPMLRIKVEENTSTHELTVLN